MRTGLKLGHSFLIGLTALLAPVSTASAEPKLEIVGGTAQEAEVSADDSVTHRASQFRFPNHIGDMPLRKVTIYGPGDVSVNYTLRGGGNGDAWITLFVYPAEQDISTEAAGIEAALIDNIHPSKIAPPGDVPPAAADGRAGWYHGTLKELQITSSYLLVRRGNWFIEARSSIPDAAGRPGIDRVLNALSAIPWDWNAQPEPPQVQAEAIL